MPLRDPLRDPYVTPYVTPTIAGGLGTARPQFARGFGGRHAPPIPKLKSCVLGGDTSFLIIETK